MSWIHLILYGIVPNSRKAEYIFLRISIFLLVLHFNQIGEEKPKTKMN